MNNSIASLFGQSVVSTHVIESAVIDPDGNAGNGSLILGLASGFKIVIVDTAQSCCEHRYLHSSDDVGSLVGESLVSIRVDSVDCIDDSGDEHEVVFLKVSTNRDSITLETHNEHNGYYGGFCIRATVYDETGKLVGLYDLDT
jgi:hypothetical protein